MEQDPNKTVGSIVADDYRAAPVFTRNGIDFCCHGGQTLAEACARHGLDQASLLNEIGDATRKGEPASNSGPTTWTLTQLADHIEAVHHRYVEETLPPLRQYLANLVKVHGARHSELQAIRDEFEACAGALTAHMKKEELILFPYVRRMEAAIRERSGEPAAPFRSVIEPVRMMEHEHEMEGDRFKRIASLSDAYSVPTDGCATYRTAYALLHQFEEDLHRHIHLENNILFPRAIAAEAREST